MQYIINYFIWICIGAVAMMPGGIPELIIIRNVNSAGKLGPLSILGIGRCELEYILKQLCILG